MVELVVLQNSYVQCVVCTTVAPAHRGCSHVFTSNLIGTVAVYYVIVITQEMVQHGQLTHVAPFLG